MVVGPSMIPEAADTQLARAALDVLSEAVDTSSDPHAPVRLRLSDAGDEVVVPKAVLDLLGGALAHFAKGEGVALVAVDGELTTQQAAELLNVSRPFVIRLADEGKVEYRKVGTHRRIKTASVLAYLDADEAQRTAAADELAAMTRELGMS